MAKFLKFNVINTAAAQPLGPTESLLVNVEDVTTVSATGLTGANAKTLIIGLTGRAAQAAGYQTLTLTISTSTGAAVNPTLTTGQANPLVQAVRSAMTANPGGVSATVQLGNDQAATPAQMYFRTATYAQQMQSQGLGDSIEKFTTKTGIKTVVDRVSEGLNIPCGCQQRKEKLNKLFPYKK